MVAAASCLAVPSFDEKGLKHPEFSFVVRFSDAQEKTFVSGDWRMNNYHLVKHGKRKKLKARTGEKYQRQLKVDIDGDGYESRLGTWMIYDLELEHRTSSAVMSVRNEVVPRRLGEKDLSVLVRSYVESMAGAEFSLGQFETAVKETRLATRIVGERSFKVAGQSAYEATVEIAQVDQVRLSGEQAVSQIRRVVLIRPPYTYKRVDRHAVYRDRAPVFVIAEYYSDPADFDKHTGDFETFLSLMDFSSDQEDKKP
jgi:hypothetical protein